MHLMKHPFFVGMTLNNTTITPIGTPLRRGKAV